MMMVMTMKMMMMMMMIVMGTKHSQISSKSKQRFYLFLIICHEIMAPFSGWSSIPNTCGNNKG